MQRTKEYVKIKDGSIFCTSKLEMNLQYLKGNITLFQIYALRN